MAVSAAVGPFQAVGNVLQSIDGAKALFLVTNRIIFWAQKFNFAFAPMFSPLKTKLRDFVNLIDSIDAFRQVGRWKEPPSGLVKIGALLSITAFRIYCLTEFLGTVGLFNKAAFIASALKIPFLSTVVSYLGTIPYVGVALMANPFLVIGVVGLGLHLLDRRWTKIKEQEIAGLYAKVQRIWEIKGEYFTETQNRNKEVFSQDLRDEYASLLEQVDEIMGKEHIRKALHGNDKIIDELLANGNREIDRCGGVKIAADTIFESTPPTAMDKRAVDRAAAEKLSLAGQTCSDKIDFECRQWTQLADAFSSKAERTSRGLFSDFCKEIDLVARMVLLMFGQVVYFTTDLSIEIIRTVADFVGGYKAWKDLSPGKPDPIVAESVPTSILAAENTLFADAIRRGVKVPTQAVTIHV